MAEKVLHNYKIWTPFIDSGATVTEHRQPQYRSATHTLTHKLRECRWKCAHLRGFECTRCWRCWGANHTTEIIEGKTREKKRKQTQTFIWTTSGSEIASVVTIEIIDTIVLATCFFVYKQFSHWTSFRCYCCMSYSVLPWHEALNWQFFEWMRTFPNSMPDIFSSESYRTRNLTNFANLVK